jgi:hypothetical protein
MQLYLTKLLVLPLVLHVLMVLFISQKMLRARIRSVQSGQTKISDIAVNSDAWPRKVKQVSNNFDNQFQTPMLWYACTALVLVLGVVDVLFVGLTWLYLLLRLVHSMIHLGSNDVPSRMKVFLLSFFVLVAMWVWLTVRLVMLG